MEDKYYQKQKERVQREVRKIYQSLSEEQKDQRRKKARERYHNFTEEEKDKQQKKLEKGIKIFLKKKKKGISIIQNIRTGYRRNYYLMHKK